MRTLIKLLVVAAVGLAFAKPKPPPRRNGGNGPVPSPPVGGWRSGKVETKANLDQGPAGRSGQNQGGNNGGADSGGSPRNPNASGRGDGIHTDYPQDAPHNMSFSDLLHVCNGDPNKPQGSGGHLSGTGVPGKTEFPEGWEMDDVKDAFQEVAGNPTDAWPTSSGNYFAEGVVDGVLVNVVVRPDGSIEAGWPISGPGVTRNPR
ncbi:EndoU domain-containing protein [Glycomyces sp. YM15]|uniref:EndoU domain-containing protein n=1 Tax=Glycomyces sp. YM15 TaxID=2800446 RepID=UPI0019645EEF|nr:EndoU domain-containing protein [Glycomyces sp. YM15]